MSHRKKLIELAIPLEGINVASRGRNPFGTGTHLFFGVISVPYDLDDLLDRAEEPAQ